jgi:hypothetical protein
MKKVPCPFCKPKKESVRGEGCCNCDHTGRVPIGEAFNFKTEEEAVNHDPQVSYYDLRDNRQHGRDLNYLPFI